MPDTLEMHVVLSIRKYFVTNLVHFVSGIHHIFPCCIPTWKKNSSMILRNMTSIRLFRYHVTIISICNFRSLNLNGLGQEKDWCLRSIWSMTRIVTFKTSWLIQNKYFLVNRISTILTSKSRSIDRQLNPESSWCQIVKSMMNNHEFDFQDLMS